MENPLENFYLQKEEPNKGCLLALRDIILSHNANITAEWKYKMPFFYYKGKMLCYIWVHKKYLQPYIGFMQSAHLAHPDLIIEKRAMVKIMLFDAEKDLPFVDIEELLKKSLEVFG
jgi:hypothetical protein